MNNIIRNSNINNYHQAIINNELILTCIYNYISLSNSKINYCIITDIDEDIISNSNKYFRILIDIYKSLSASFILQNTTFNIKLTNEDGNKGYNWCPEINMSVQGKDANGTLREIIKMVNLNNYKIDIEIELADGTKNNYKI